MAFKLANPSANTQSMDVAIPRITPHTSVSTAGNLESSAEVDLDLIVNLGGLDPNNQMPSITHDFDYGNKKILQVSSRLSVIYFSLLLCSIFLMVAYSILVARGYATATLCTALRVMIVNLGSVCWCICCYFTLGRFADDYQRVCAKCDGFCIELAVFWIDSNIRFKLNQMLDHNQDNDQEKD